jgi:RNA polymerase sigma factor (sigma-70 family)
LIEYPSISFFLKLLPHLHFDCRKKLFLQRFKHLLTPMGTQHIPHDDQYILEALVQHDSSVVAAVYRDYSGMICALVIENGGATNDAGDVFQDALIDIYRQAQRGYMLTCSFKSFLYTVCRNKWLDELRRRGRMEVTIQGSERFTTEIAEDNADRLYQYEERLALLAATVETLGPSCRDILKLAWTPHSQTNKYPALSEVAEQLGLSYAYLRKKKSECEQALREKMKKAPEFTQLKDQ